MSIGLAVNIAPEGMRSEKGKIQNKKKKIEKTNASHVVFLAVTASTFTSAEFAYYWHVPIAENCTWTFLKIKFFMYCIDHKRF